MMKTSSWQADSAEEEDVLLLAGLQDLCTRHGLTFIQGVVDFFFLCRWLKTLKEAKEAKYESGCFQQNNRHVSNICTLDMVEYDNSWYKELCLLDRE